MFLKLEHAVLFCCVFTLWLRFGGKSAPVLSYTSSDCTCVDAGYRFSVASAAGGLAIEAEDFVTASNNKITFVEMRRRVNF